MLRHGTLMPLPGLDLQDTSHRYQQDTKKLAMPASMDTRSKSLPKCRIHPRFRATVVPY
jgi:hypothetical protein